MSNQQLAAGIDRSFQIRGILPPSASLFAGLWQSMISSNANHRSAR
jgi:hypothetical protein